MNELKTRPVLKQAAFLLPLLILPLAALGKSPPMGSGSIATSGDDPSGAPDGSEMRMPLLPGGDDGGPGNQDGPGCTEVAQPPPSGLTYYVKGQLMEVCIGSFGTPLPGFNVEAWGKWQAQYLCGEPDDVPFDMAESRRLAIGVTDSAGRFTLQFQSGAFVPSPPQGSQLAALLVNIRLKKPDNGIVFYTSPYKLRGAANTYNFPNLKVNGCVSDRCEEMPVYRARFTVTTANVEDAGSDDGVLVELNGQNATWLDYGRDDFERNTVYSYDLLLDGLSTLSDVTQLRISKTGSDGWCIRSMAMAINGRTVYSQTFPNPGRWLDNDGGLTRVLTIGSATLRSNSLWRACIPPPVPLAVPRAEIESRIEGIVGHEIHGTQAEWGDRYGPRWVEAKKDPNQASGLNVDLDLGVKIDYAPNPELDLDFDLAVTCNAGILKLSGTNIRAEVDFDWYIELLADYFADGLIGFVEDYIASRIEGAIGTISQEIATGQDRCPSITVLSNGDITFLP